MTPEEEKNLTAADIQRELEEYQKFALNSTMVQASIAFVVAAAFGKIIDALVKNIVMPVFNWVVNLFLAEHNHSVDWRTLTWVPAKEMKLEIGAFIGATIDFFIISVVMYIVWRFAKKYAPLPDPPPTPPTPPTSPVSFLGLNQ